MDFKEAKKQARIDARKEIIDIIKNATNVEFELEYRFVVEHFRFDLLEAVGEDYD